MASICQSCSAQINHLLTVVLLLLARGLTPTAAAPRRAACGSPPRAGHFVKRAGEHVDIYRVTAVTANASLQLVGIASWAECVVAGPACHRDTISIDGACWPPYPLRVDSCPPFPTGTYPGQFRGQFVKAANGPTIYRVSAQRNALRPVILYTGSPKEIA